jgi:hypothetical protein
VRAGVLFNLEEDRGDFLCGYIVGDSFVDSMRISLISGGGVVYERLADDMRAPMAAAGRHQTGRCGFCVDEAAAPGLSSMDDLEIRESSSGALIYRRRRPEHVMKRVLRLETHLFPLWRLDNALNGHFQYAANQIEALGRETVSQMFVLYEIPSVYLSGRLLYRPHRHEIEDKFEVLFSMHHPYEELAERLIVLAQIKKTGSAILGLRENMSLQPTMDFARSLPFDNEQALARALREMPVNVARVLSNPIVRQLTTSSPDEMPSKSAVAGALSAVSMFQVVGLRRAPKTFRAAVSELTGRPVEGFDAATLPGVRALARLLKRTREVDWLIEQDLALYSHIAEAYRMTANSPAPQSSV